ncbi:hypothetical protein HDG41_007260 [Paraburkholderia sp. JPY162]|uniref:Uncharacterized protein n=1 Tax=Paraburkholderia youngii TaxID=2782701 RepID=A0A7W8P576_9BURK|nr:hypothetical protein [Paraburkholderia youngii]
MRHASIIKTGLAVACSLMIAGCAVNQGDINAAYDGAHRIGSDAMANLPGSMALVEDVPTAFLGDRLVPVAYEATLPATFREKKVTMPAMRMAVHHQHFVAGESRRLILQRTGGMGDDAHRCEPEGLRRGTPHDPRPCFQGMLLAGHLSERTYQVSRNGFAQ